MSRYHADNTLTLLTGDAVDQLRTLPDRSVDCVVTSPPYYGLRDYHGHPGQIGLEDTPAAYLARLVEVFGEIRRVLALNTRRVYRRNEHGVLIRGASGIGPERKGAA